MKIKAFHLDMKAGCYKKGYLKKLFPRLSNLGFTHIVFEIEDKVRLDNILDANWHEAYSKEEFEEIIKDSRQAGLTPIPLIQTMGHMEYLLSHKRYHQLRESPKSAYMLCPLNMEARSFIKNLLYEIIELFNNPPYIHLGADETRLLADCPECSKYAKDSGIPALYAEYVNELAEIVLSKRSRPLIWADMPLSHPKILNLLRKDIILVDWDYFTGDKNPDSIRIWGKGFFTAEQKEKLPEGFLSGVGKYAFSKAGELRPWPYTKYLLELGFEVWIAPALSCAGDHYFAPAFMHLENITGAASRLSQNPAPSGLLLTSWALRLNHIEAQWPGAAILKTAEKTGKTMWENLEQDVSSAVFGVKCPEFFRAWELISEPLIHTHSRLGIEHDIHYYGPTPPMVSMMEQWEKEGKTNHEKASLEEKISGYREGRKIIEKLYPQTSSGRPTLDFWNFAGEAMQIKAQELRISLEAHETGNYDKNKAAQLLLETEGSCDDYRKLLSESYMPSSVERYLSVMFDGSKMNLMKMANK